jgi:alpha-ketoglutarate-dependent taurine dioxygenase
VLTELPAALNVLRNCGWVVLPGVLKEDHERKLLDMAQAFGEPVASRPSGPRVDRLAPVTANHSHPRSLSRVFGMGVFPLHTDTAHWPIPARFVLLACVSPGRAGRKTLLLSISDLSLEPEEHRLLLSGVFLVRNGKNSFYASVLSVDRPFIRLDPGCMSPATSEGSRAWEMISRKTQHARPTAVIWQPGDVLVIDNWRTLHGREAANGDEDRLIIRVMVRTLAPPWEAP